MLVAGGADTQLGSSYALAPLATNVDLWKLVVIECNVFIIREAAAQSITYHDN